MISGSELAAVQLMVGKLIEKLALIFQKNQ